MAENFDLEKMRSDIYEQLKAAYKEHPETLSTGAKTILAILATTRYMDHHDARSDIIADIATRVELAEKLMGEIETGTYKGPGEPTNMIGMLVPMDMIEYAEGFSKLNELVHRMHEVVRRNVDFGIHEYEKAHGLPLSDFRSPVDVYFESLDADSDFEHLSEEEMNKLLEED